jgi:alkanesulfonate monooxygenase SsuD/methylene tetrahydromethanopterin reductase-like flavin-dependent oxidoreductase (luciferase family)
MKFGAALPTCAEGAGYPIGFAPPDVLATIAERAEALGFYAVMANDHLSTPNLNSARFLGQMSCLVDHAAAVA